MKTKQLLTQDLKTGDITIMSNVTSVTATCIKVARVEEIPGQELDNPSAVHVDFKVKQPSHFHTVLEDTEALGLILGLEDSVELGLLLVAMGMEHKTTGEAAAIMDRLSKMISDFQPS